MAGAPTPTGGFGGMAESFIRDDLLPLAQVALPAIAGALSSPRLSGSRGVIASGLAGGAEGLNEVMRQRTANKEFLLRQQNVQSEIQYRTSLMTQTQRAAAAQDKSLPTLRKMLHSQMDSPLGKQFFGDAIKPEDLDSLGFESTTNLLEQLDKAQEGYIRSGGQVVIKDSQPIIGSDGKPHTYRDVVNKRGDVLSHHDLGVRYETPVKPERPREQVVNDAKTGEAVIVNLDTGEERPLKGLTKTAPKAPSTKEQDIQDWLSRNKGKTREDAEIALARDIAGAKAAPAKPMALWDEKGVLHFETPKEGVTHPGWSNRAPKEPVTMDPVARAQKRMATIKAFADAYAKMNPPPPGVSLWDASGWSAGLRKAMEDAGINPHTGAPLADTAGGGDADAVRKDLGLGH